MPYPDDIIQQLTERQGLDAGLQAQLHLSLNAEGVEAAITAGAAPFDCVFQIFPMDLLELV
jgi:hypothetical protein